MKREGMGWGLSYSGLPEQLSPSSSPQSHHSSTKPKPISYCVAPREVRLVLGWRSAEGAGSAMGLASTAARREGRRSDEKRIFMLNRWFRLGMAVAQIIAVKSVVEGVDGIAVIARRDLE